MAKQVFVRCGYNSESRFTVVNFPDDGVNMVGIGCMFCGNRLVVTRLSLFSAPEDYHAYYFDSATKAYILPLVASSFLKE